MSGTGESLSPINQFRLPDPESGWANSSYLAALKYMRRSQSLTPGIQTSSSCWVTVSPSGEGNGCKSGSLACKTGTEESQPGPSKGCCRQARPSCTARRSPGQTLRPGSRLSTSQDHFTQSISQWIASSLLSKQQTAKVKPGQDPKTETEMVMCG